ncbi:MAG: hypothetical protein QXP36_07540 [Conexivisphaerales archaeon]
MKERPKGRAEIIEVEGDKEIIVVIPTADFNGKYAKECRENIFKGVHIIFVESGYPRDPYFNYAHSCNIGIKKAMEYNPKWIVISGDDVIKVDELEILRKELYDLDPHVYDYVACTPTTYHSQTDIIAKKNQFYSLYMLFRHRTEGMEIIKIVKKFKAEYLRIQDKKIYSLFADTKCRIIENGDFGIYSNNFLKNLDGQLFDETFINAWEETELAMRIFVEKRKIARIKFALSEHFGTSLGTGYARTLRDLAGQTYFDHKWSSFLGEIERK